MNRIPLHSLVVVVGPQLGGKSTWCRSRFDRNEILDPDDLRCELTGSVDNHMFNHEVWNEIYNRTDLRLGLGQRVVIDSTNLKNRDRHLFVDLAAKHGVPVFYVPINQAMEVKLAAAHAPPRDQLEKSDNIFTSCEREIMSGDNGLAQVVSQDCVITPFAMPNVLQHDRILAVGDVHGNHDAMQRALQFAQQENLFVVWLGDVVDYGAHNLRCVKLAYDTVKEGSAAMIWGNHEKKIDRWITSNWGADYQGRLSDANVATVNEIEALNPARQRRFLSAWNALKNWSNQHLVAGNFLFSHGAATPAMWNMRGRRLPGQHGNWAYYGQVSESQPNRGDGYPNRVWHWVDSVPHNHTVVVGHDWLDRVNNGVTLKTGALGGSVWVVDCGSSKGGRLGGVVIDTVAGSVTPQYWDL